jgi:hypothetical protein
MLLDSKYSNKDLTGTRVPLETGVPARVYRSAFTELDDFMDGVEYMTIETNSLKGLTANFLISPSGSIFPTI